MTEKKPPRDEAADAVRSYLTFLRDPSELLNPMVTKALREKLEKLSDPLEQLKVQSAIASSEKLDEASLRAEFVKAAPTYARREGIAAEAFLAMGVDEDTLVEAGLLESPAVSSRRAGEKGGSGRTGAKRQGAKGNAPTGAAGSGKRISKEMVAKKVPGGYFTIRDLEEASGASYLTVKSTIDEMVKQGALQEHGPDPKYAGRGKAPRRFKKP